MDTGQIIQLTAAGAIALTFFLLVHSVPERRIIYFLILLIPFQILTSRYGSINIFFTYFVAFAFLLQGRFVAAPVFWSAFLLLFAYAIAFALSHPDGYFRQLLFMIGFVCNFVMFYMVYNFLDRTHDWTMVIRALIWSNVIYVAACLIEIALGNNQITLFGVSDWKFGSPRSDQGRLVGPFSSTHTTADYLVAQCMIIGFWLIYARPSKPKWLLVLLALNFICLIATGDRGGFVEILVGGLLFLFLFRKDIGGFRIVSYSVVAAILFAGASLVVVEYTDFDRLFERLETTELEGENRPRAQGFAQGFRWFDKSPFVGHGPKFDVAERGKPVGEIVYRGAHPHNLILAILVTTGIIGLVAWIIFILSIVIPIFTSLKYQRPDDPLLSNMPKLALLLMLLFMMGEMRIEFLRDEYFDYQQYIFVLLSVFFFCSRLLVSQDGQLEGAIDDLEPEAPDALAR